MRGGDRELVDGVEVDEVLVAAQRRLLRAESRYAALVAALPGRVVIVFDADLRITLLSGHALDRLRTPPAALIGTSVSTLLQPDAEGAVRDSCLSALEGGQVTGRQLEIGGVVWRIDVCPLAEPDDGSPSGLLVALDVTEEVRDQRERDRMLRELEQAQRVSVTGSWRWDAATGEMWWSPELRRILRLGDGAGPDLEEALTRLSHPDDVPALRAAWKQAVRERRPFELAHRCVRDDGSLQHVVIRAEPILDPAGLVCGVRGTTQDVTDHQLARVALAESEERFRQAEGELLRTARYDPLTGLPNRAALMEHLEARLAGGHQPVAVLFVDLDDFKTVNDSLGHVAGDRLLERVALHLNRCLHPSDFAARWGGDEFVVVHPCHGRRDARALANRIRSALSEPVTVEGHEVSTTVSVGVALAGPASTGADLMRDADTAMYRAKAAGKDRWAMADSGDRADALRRLTVSTALRHALAADDLRLHYQPVYDLRTSRLVSVEALLRWRHPDQGLLRPHEFLDVAEGSGLIVAVGDWAVRTACAQAARWHRRFGPAAPSVAVNACARQLGQLGRTSLHHQVSRALAETGLPASGLCIELTEREAVATSGAEMNDLERLHEMGVRLAVDDFGTGYAGFDYLRRIPVDILKIDQSFVAGLDSDSTDSAITVSLITLGQALSLVVVAEGVETAAQHDLLAELGCPQGQGLLWSPAVPADRITALLDGTVAS